MMQLNELFKTTSHVHWHANASYNGPMQGFNISILNTATLMSMSRHYSCCLQESTVVRQLLSYCQEIQNLSVIN